MAEQQDYTGLDWVREEIESTLAEARQALELYQDDIVNPAHLDACLAAFQQVLGALKMLNQDGAYHLCQEMAKLTDALIKDTVADRQQALENLMLGVLQLPAYIQQTINSGVDQPFVILALINDLRKLRGIEALSEATFFYPEISFSAEVIEQPQLDRLEKSGLNTLLRKIRQKYQLCLAGYLRDQDRNKQIKILEKIFAKLQDICWGAPLAPLWEASIALMEGLENQSINKHSLHIVNLLRELDHQIRLFIEQGSSFINTTPDDKLLREILYYLATSGSETGFIGVLNQRYRLVETLNSARSGTPGSLAGVDASTPVVEAINTELTGIKEALDLYLLSSSPDPLVLQNQLPVIQQVADTLSILGMGNFQAKLKEKAELVKEVINTGQNAETHLMDVASTILKLETALAQFAAGQDQQENDETLLIREVYQAVIKEARQQLVQTKDAIVDYIDSQHSEEYLNQIPELLHKVHGGLAMTPLDRAAALLERCAKHIQLEWVERRSIPEKEELEHLADAVTSVEYYLERLDDKVHDNHEAILDVAEESLNALNPLIEEPLISPLDESDNQGFLDGSLPVAFEEEVEQIETESTPAPISGENVIEFDFTAANTVEAATAESETPQAESDNALDFPSNSFTLSENSDTEPAPEQEDDNDSFIDDELLEVFIEEAGEVQQQLAEGVPLWLSNQENEKVLTDVRRAFHTLKGSGRMVGANVVGELAWSIENMLNRLIDGTIQSTHELRLLIDQVTGMLPALITDFAKQNQVLTPEVLECMEKADALAKGEQYTVPGDDTASEPKNILDDEEATPVEIEVEPEIVEAAIDLSSFETSDTGTLITDEAEALEEPKSEADYDLQLLNIFLSESRLHLETVQNFVDQVKAQGGKRQISDEVQRSLHTLKGIALMTEITPLANLIVALEKNIKDFRAHLIPADDRVINMLEKGLELIDDGLQQLSASPNEPKLEEDDYLGWLEALHAQLLSEHQKQEENTRIYTGGQKSDLFAEIELIALLNADHYLSSWRDQLSSDELLEFQSELNAIRTRAENASLEAMAELCDVLIGVIGYLNTHEKTLPKVLSAPLSNGFEALIDMMNQVAAQQTPVSPQSVFSELRKSLEELLTPAVESSEPEEQSTEELAIELSEDSEPEEIIVELAEKPEPEEIVVELTEEPEPEEIIVELSDEESELVSDIEVDALETHFDTGDVEQLILESLKEEPVPQEADDSNEIVFEEFTLEDEGETKPELDSAPVETPAPESLQAPVHTLNIEVEEHDLELQELFLEEAGDLLEDSNLALEQWLHDTGNTLPLAELQRILHTLKGSARMADQPDIGDLSHALEDVYSAITNGRQAGDLPLKMIQAAHDHIDLMVQTLKDQQTPPAVTPLIERLESWVLNNEDIEPALSVESQKPEAEPLPDYLGHSDTVTLETRPESLEAEDILAVAATEVAVTSQPELKPESQTQVQPQQVEVVAEKPEPVVTKVDTPVTQNLVKSNELIRVPAQLIEQLINLSGESSINRGRIEQQIQDVSHTLEEMDSTIDRVKEQLRRLDTETQAQIISTYDGEEADNPEFDPLEMDQYSELTQLSRSLVESATDLKDLKEAIQDKNRDAETLLLQQHRTQLDLQEKLIQARMVSFSRLLPRLRKITRQLSNELGKPANLNVSNAEGEMDRTMLERILAPLEHMLRNAIGHGLEESSEDRLARGKSAEGNLDLSIARDGADIVLELKDDGRGINLEKVHAKAVEKRLISPTDKLTDQEIAELILEPGFTTADAITQISGRGVGLDIVNTEIRQLGGSIQISTEKDLGTTITLRLPFTLSVNRALMVAVGENLYALPMQAIDGISTVTPEVLTDCYQNSRPLMYAGQEHKVMFLGDLLGTSRPRIQPEQCPVILIQRGGQNLALHVDEVIGGREIFTKSLGPQFTGLTGVNGATILGDGRVVIIIDPAALARRQRTESRQVNLEDDSKTADVVRRVLVVDDSVTVRKVTTRLLERSGFEVESARDGVEAMTRLSESSYDIMLLDIEMPKMDGFEVASAVRNDSRIAALPIIMITSRTGEKHKTRAFSLGVNEYLGKPFQETALLSSIDKLIGNRKGVI